MSINQRLRRRDDIVDVNRRIPLQQFDAAAHVRLQQFLANVHQHRDRHKLRRDRRAVREAQHEVPQRQHVRDGELEHEQNRDPAERVEFGHDHELLLEMLVELRVAHLEEEGERLERLREAALALVVGDRAEVVAAPLHQRLEAEEDVRLDVVHLGRVAVAGGPQEEADHLVHALRVGAAAVDAGEEEEDATERELRRSEGHAAEGRFFGVRGDCGCGRGGRSW